MTKDAALMQVAEEQIDWIASKLEISREAGRLALLSALMAVRDDAAAPQLLTMLRALVYVAPENPFTMRDPRYGAWPRLLKDARAAIAKAEGWEP